MNAMFKLLIKYYLIEKSIDIMFNVVSSNFTKPVWVKGSQLTQFHIGMTVVDVDVGNYCLASRFYDALLGSTIIKATPDNSPSVTAYNRSIIIKTTSDKSYLKYFTIDDDTLFLIK